MGLWLPIISLGERGAANPWSTRLVWIMKRDVSTHKSVSNKWRQLNASLNCTIHSAMQLELWSSNDVVTGSRKVVTCHEWHQTLVSWHRLIYVCEDYLVVYGLCRLPMLNSILFPLYLCNSITMTWLYLPVCDPMTSHGLAGSELVSVSK